MQKRLAIYGADGFGREVLQLAKRQGNAWSEIVFVDDNPDKVGSSLDLHPIYDFERTRAGHFKHCVAVADSSIRRLLIEKILNSDAELVSLIATSAIVSDVAEIGPGAIISDNVTITANCKIGMGFHANIYSYVAHDCLIGDYVTFAPRVSCNGRVSIEDGAYIGTSAIIRQGSHEKPVTIGAGAVVGMGAVVTKDVAPGTTVIGSPARPIEKK